MSALVKPGSLGFILLDSQIITEADISAALEEQQKSGCKFGEALVLLGVVTQEDIDWALSNQLNIPYVRLKRDMIDREAVDLLPGYICRQYGIMPIIRYGNELSVAMIDPLNSAAIAAVEELTGCTVTVSVALIRELREMQELFYGPMAGGDTLGFSSALFPEEALSRINADLTGAKLTEYLFNFMAQQSLASLSMQPVAGVCRLVARKKGVSREIGAFPLDRYASIVQRLRRQAGIDGTGIAERGIITFPYKGAELALQAHFLRMSGGECITLKRRVQAAFPASVDDFITSAAERKLLEEICRLERGIILCTAGNRDDRDRLTAFCLGEIAARGKTVVFAGSAAGRSLGRFPGVDTSGLGKAEFVSLLSELLEHETDVIALEDVGEEHLLLGAGRAAMRGRLVVAGLAEGDQAAVFDLVVHLWRQHHFLPGQLRGIVNCCSVQLLCPHCRQSYQPAAEELAVMGLVTPPREFFTAGGCAECAMSGYSSRRYLLEVVAMTADTVQALERSGNGREVVQFLNTRGLTGVRAHGVALLDGGEISPQEFIAALLQ
jgi:type II secretory ATPase GspE/PulE/Tfp pilus assembly ATPase PilB-like protein